jgi:hypothetical protein
MAVSSVQSSMPFPSSNFNNMDDMDVDMDIDLTLDPEETYMEADSVSVCVLDFLAHTPNLS